MTKELAWKKKVRGGHKASAMQMMSRVDEVMAADEDPDISKLNQLRMSLKERYSIVKYWLWSRMTN